MKIMKTTIASVITATLALGMAEQASASVYAGSRLIIDDLVVGISNLAGPAADGYTFTTDAGANLNGAGSADALATCNQGSCSNVAPVLQSTANAPGGAPIRADGNFSFFGPVNGTQTYANAASEIGEATLATGAPTTVGQISETELVGSGIGVSDTAVSSESVFTFDFTILNNATGNLFLSFKADPNIFLALDTPNATSATATGSISASFTLVGANGDQVSWTPDGQNFGIQAADFGDCTGLVCNEFDDTEDLNLTRTIPFVNPVGVSFSDDRLPTLNASADMGLQDYGIGIFGLEEGGYTLTFTTTTLARAEQNVPEPGILALLGISLAGLGFSKRQKS